MSDMRMIVEIVVFLYFVITAYFAFLAGSYAKKVDALKDRLTRIAAQEKPTSNATVRRMARIARGEE